jgi:hypothetical protein
MEYSRRFPTERASRRKEGGEACNGDEEKQYNNQRETVGFHGFSLPVSEGQPDAT